jgi:hypothetical protein
MQTRRPAPQNQGDVDIVDGETFAATYREVRPGVSKKDAPVWAKRAEAAGVIRTKEVSTDYGA